MLYGLLFFHNFLLTRDGYGVFELNLMSAIILVSPQCVTAVLKTRNNCLNARKFTFNYKQTHVFKYKLSSSLTGELVLSCIDKSCVYELV